MIKISEANHCNKTVTDQGILHLIFPSLNYAMNFREGSPQIRMLTCYCPKPSLPHTLWGSVFGTHFHTSYTLPKFKSNFPPEPDRDLPVPAFFGVANCELLNFRGVRGSHILVGQQVNNRSTSQLFRPRRRRVVGPSCESLLAKNSTDCAAEGVGCKDISHFGHWNKSSNFILPTKYWIPKSLKVSNWLSTTKNQPIGKMGGFIFQAGNVTAPFSQNFKNLRLRWASVVSKIVLMSLQMEKTLKSLDFQVKPVSFQAVLYYSNQEYGF